MLREQGDVQEQKRLKEVKKQMVQARVRLKDVRALNVAAQECVFWTKVCLEALKNGECDTAVIKGGEDRKLGTVKKYDAQLRDGALLKQLKGHKQASQFLSKKGAARHLFSLPPRWPTRFQAVSEIAFCYLQC